MANVVAVLLVSTLVTLPTPLSAQEGTGIVAEITELLTQYEKIWNSQDFPRLRELWDTDDPEPYYVPEEIEEPLIGWPALNRYWSPPRPGGKSMLEAFRWGFSNVRARLLAPDLALSIFDHRYEMKLRGERNKPSAGFDRCIGIFRKKPEGWRFILYAQCPLGPETYVRALRGKIVSPDFEDFRKKIQEKEKE
jgi:hypothetical protein